MTQPTSQRSAASTLPEELRRVVWRHAVDLYAYFGKPVEALSEEQLALWFGMRSESERQATDAPTTELTSNAASRSVFVSRDPFEIDITPSWWIARGLYDGGRAVLAALASPELEVTLTGYGAEVRVGIDGVTLRYLRPRDMTDKMLRLQRLAIMRALEAARPSDAARSGSASVEDAAERLGELARAAAGSAAVPLDPRALREALRPILTRNSPASVLTLILHVLEECVCEFSHTGKEEARALALSDAVAVRTAIAALSRESWRPFHDTRADEASAQPPSP